MLFRGIAATFIFAMTLVGMLTSASEILPAEFQASTNSSNSQASDTANLKLIGTITISTEPFCIAVNENTNRIYVGTRGTVDTDNVVVIDGTTKLILTKIQVPHAYKILINPQTNRIFAVTMDGIGVIDGTTNRLVGNISKLILHDDEVELNPVTNFLYVADSAGIMGEYDRVRIYDGETLKWQASINIPESLAESSVHQVGVGVNPATNRIYVTWGRGPAIYLVDGSSNAIVKSASVSGLTIVACNPFTNYVYMFARRIIDGETLEEVNSIPPGIVGSFNLINHILYAINGTEINIADGYTQDVFASVALEESPICSSYANLAVNTKTGEIYAIQPSAKKVLAFQGPCASRPLLICDFLISPDKVQAGETVKISFRIRNLRDMLSFHTIVLRINNSETVRQIELISKENRIVDFLVVKSTAGEYTVTVEGLTGRFVVSPAETDLKMIGIIIGVIGIVIFVCVLRRVKPSKKRE